jgi:hypothetical protein
MSPTSPKASKFWRIVFTVILILCILPIGYIGVYRPLDYGICRSMISLKLGLGFSPFTLEGYVQDSLSPGLSREEVSAKLEEIGRIKITLLGRFNDTWVDQINLQVCTDPFNRIIILAGYSANSRLISIRIADE